ncbi:DNA-binding protein [Streptomyces sp. NBC_00285]|uniref:MmyB family transcriptional regulator n=1 Tax=Streptomyces sp. NBC_00285 TaxID=2975700 RepID=UPI002E2C3D64|nr:DNA-binding protein [Streptomyces sp. NBC_00285]
MRFSTCRHAVALGHCDWGSAATVTAAPLRAEAGRYPDDKDLPGFIGELSTVSPEFRTRGAAQHVCIHHGGVKRFDHPEPGDLELTYQPRGLPMSVREAHSLTIYTAEPGSSFEDGLRLLASWVATHDFHQRSPSVTHTGRS